jgi:hypothetical protein
MPIHDWTRVDAGIFHAFHHGWITDLARALNRGLLPADHYALPEQIAGGIGPPARYATRAKSVVVRHTSDHRVIAMIEIVSPGNKNSRHGIRSFINKAAEMLAAGVHLLILDLLPPGPRDPQGIHALLWSELVDDSPFALPPDAPLTLAAYIGGVGPEAFVEPRGVGMTLPDMPLFLTPEVYVPVPLEATYNSAWEGLPAFWRSVLDQPT